MNSTPLLRHLDIYINLSLFLYFLIKTFKILKKKGAFYFKQNDHPNCYSLWNYSAYRRIINFQINTISIFFSYTILLKLSSETVENIEQKL